MFLNLRRARAYGILITLVDYKLAGPPKLSNGPPNFSRRGPEDPIIWKPGYISAYNKCVLGQGVTLQPYLKYPASSLSRII